MKTKTITRTFITLIAMMMMAMTAKQVNATNYLILDLNTITNNDSVYRCTNNYDSIMFIANGGNGGTNTWIFTSMYPYSFDTTLSNYSDTLILPLDIYGEMHNYNSVSGSKSFYICPIGLYVGEGATISCSDSTSLYASTNYSGTGSVTYSWLPVTGLNNPNIANPVASPNSSTNYTITAMINGCTFVDSIEILMTPMSMPAICIVGVDSTNKNMIVWNKPLSAKIDSFYVYRETSVTNVYQKIGVVSYDSFSMFIDTNSYPNVQSNKYKLSIIDKCRIESYKSSAHKTMHLNISYGLNNSWDLAWEPYEGFTVSTYKIYRGTADTNMQLIGTTSGSSTQYSDYTAPAGIIYYMIEVVSANNCNPTKSYNSSRSNIATNNPNGVNENNNSTVLFSIYPNPATENLTIQTNQKAIIEILNIEGQIIMAINGTDTLTTIDIKDLSSGVYIVKVKTDNGSAVKKFIKE
jgi:hypothetical protein